ncbi:transposase [Streptomyces sp. NPDC031705]|uniref:transposase n=1 Tax=Streptomyces sp. NPDC031705 TaxID=3155729 RepID=UPI0033CBD94C
MRRRRIRHGQSDVICGDAGSGQSSQSLRTRAVNRKRLGRCGGRPPAFDRETYKQRNTVERCINKLKQWRGLATRYDKTATIYLAGLHLAAIFIWSAR